MAPFAVILLLAGCAPPLDTDALPAACNGSAALCDRTFDTVTLPGTHNSMSNEDDGWSIPNQRHNLGQQLDDGIRAMLIDSHDWDPDGDGVSAPYLCHAYCELGAIPLVDALTTVRTFLDDRPGEVMAFIIEDYISTDETDAAFDAADLSRLTFTPTAGQIAGSEAWPTLGAMVAADQRLLVTSENQGPPPDWYEPAWSLYVDTPYTFAGVADFNCDINRGDPSNPLFLLNHWLEDPTSRSDLAAEANAYDVLNARATECAAAFGRNPNIVAVDWYDEGDLFAVVGDLNAAYQK